MNRSERLHNLLINSPTHSVCNCEAWQILGTAGMRAASELRKTLTDSDFYLDKKPCPHKKKGYTMYCLREKQKQLQLEALILKPSI